MEHVNAFAQYSTHPFHNLNTLCGLPTSINAIKWDAIILHYSLFGIFDYKLDDSQREFIRNYTSCPKIAFFQDEYRHCRRRFDFINEMGIDAVCTMLEPEWHVATYQKHTNAKTIISAIPGYVCDDTVRLCQQYTKPFGSRSIDVGYRARPLDYYMGRGAQEKTQIADLFLEHAKDLPLTLDVKTGERDRIYGNHWYEFLGSCKSVLGVESGVSIFDITGEVEQIYQSAMKRNPGMTFEEFAPLVERFEDQIYYRTISPRHFESAASGATQILFEGRYSNLMQPYVHYQPLKKDFSNFDEVVALLQNPTHMQDLARNAYRDLIESGDCSYRGFLRKFDQALQNMGVAPTSPSKRQQALLNRLRREYAVLWKLAQLKSVRNWQFPGRSRVARIAKSLFGLT